MAKPMKDMLSQLIKMLGTIQSEQQEMKQELSEMKQEQQEIKGKLHELEVKSEERHQEILERFKAIENDQDFIWEKTARNEREIGNLKRQLT